MAALSERGYRLALLSNWDQRLRGLLQALDLAAHFEVMIISGEVGVEKPDIEIFRIAERAL